MNDRLSKYTPAQKKAILARGGNVLVSASAGTGKTSVLTERVMSIIMDRANPCDIDELIIMTFTKAAAQEMKERILNTCNSILLEDPENEHIQRQAALMPHAQITTIDSLCMNIVKNYFYLIDIDPGFRIADEQEGTLLIQDVLDELLEGKYAAGDEAFINMMESLVPKRNLDVIKDYIVRLYKISESHADPAGWLNEVKKAYDIEASEDGSPDFIKKTGILSYTREVVKKAVRILDEAIAMCCAAELGQVYDMLVGERNGIEGVLMATSYSEYSERLNELTFARFPSPRNLDEDIKEIKDRILELRTYVKDKLINKLIKDYYYKFPQEVYIEIMLCKETADALIDITLEFADRYKKEKRQLNIADFSDIEHMALDILSIPDSYAAQELRGIYKHILVDEYQDINEVQDRLIYLLSREPEGTPNVFMVGDVKQSIYKFRLANPDIFEHKRSTYTDEDSSFQRIMLQNNFRSDSAILGTVNYIFSNIMHQNVGNIEYDDTHAFYYDEEKTSGDVPEAVYISYEDYDISEYGKKKLEAAYIAERIKELTGEETGRYGYDDIVILLRSMGEWSTEFAEVLRANDIPVICDEHTGYFATKEVQLAVSMLKIIDNPDQDIPLTMVLKSVFGKFTDTDLAVVRAKNRRISMYKALCKAASESDISDKASAFLEKLNGLRRDSAYMSVYELIMKIYKTDDFMYHMEALSQGDRRVANLNMLARTAVNFENTDKRGLYDFIRYIDKMRKADIDFGTASAENASGAVRIMTIHSSKGLEFPVVFVAGMEKQFNLKDTRNNVVINSDFGVGIDFFSTKRRTRYKTLIKKAFADKITLDSIGEELRVLYVALTRPKSKLIMTGVVEDLEKYFDKHNSISGNEITYYKWLTPCFAKHKSFTWFGADNPDGDYPDMKFVNVHASELIIDSAEAAVNLSQKRNELVRLAENEQLSDSESSMYDNIMAYSYPFANEANIAVKMSVSEIKHRQALAVDEEAVTAAWAQTEPEYVPGFAKNAEEESGIGGAARGTVYHTFMEHIKINEIASLDDVIVQVNELIAKGILPEDTLTGNIIRADKIFKFAKSSLGQRMGMAQAKRTCYAEQPFVMGLPASEIYDVPESKETVLVQGIIDMFFEEEDGIVLVDYKTDRIYPGEENVLKDRYRAQLECYKQAIEKTHEKPVKEMMLYSFALDKEIVL